MQLQSYLNPATNWLANGRIRSSGDKFLYRLGCSAVDLFARSMLAMDVVWRAPLPNKPKIFAANHPTTIDPFLLLRLAPERMSILVTGGAFTVPMFGRYLRRAGHVPVIRGDGRAAFEEAKRLLESGRSIGIFPEGALSPVGVVGQPRTGVARLALSSGAPVIPVGIGLAWGRIWFVPAKIDGEQAVGRFYWRGPYAMTVGEPMFFKGSIADQDRVRSVAGDIMERIQVLSRQSAQRIDAAQPSLPALEPGALDLANAG